MHTVVILPLLFSFNMNFYFHLPFMISFFCVCMNSGLYFSCKPLLIIMYSYWNDVYIRSDILGSTICFVMDTLYAVKFLYFCHGRSWSSAFFPLFVARRFTLYSFSFWNPPIIVFWRIILIVFIIMNCMLLVCFLDHFQEPWMKSELSTSGFLSIWWFFRYCGFSHTKQGIFSFSMLCKTLSLWVLRLPLR